MLILYTLSRYGCESKCGHSLVDKVGRRGVHAQRGGGRGGSSWVASPWRSPKEAALPWSSLVEGQASRNKVMNRKRCHPRGRSDAAWPNCVSVDTFGFALSYLHNSFLVFLPRLLGPFFILSVSFGVDQHQGDKQYKSTSFTDVCRNANRQNIKLECLISSHFQSFSLHLFGASNGIRFMLFIYLLTYSTILMLFTYLFIFQFLLFLIQLFIFWNNLILHLVERFNPLSFHSVHSSIHFFLFFNAVLRFKSRLCGDYSLKIQKVVDGLDAYHCCKLWRHCHLHV